MRDGSWFYMKVSEVTLACHGRDVSQRQGPSIVQGLIACRKCGFAFYRTSTRSSARKIHFSPSVLSLRATSARCRFLAIADHVSNPTHFARHTLQKAAMLQLRLLHALSTGLHP